MNLPVRIRRKSGLWDLIVYVTGMVTSVVWTLQGHERDGLVLAAVTYWGTPWSGQ